MDLTIRKLLESDWAVLYTSLHYWQWTIDLFCLCNFKKFTNATELLLQHMINNKIFTRDMWGTKRVRKLKSHNSLFYFLFFVCLSKKTKLVWNYNSDFKCLLFKFKWLRYKNKMHNINGTKPDIILLYYYGKITWMRFESMITDFQRINSKKNKKQKTSTQSNNTISHRKVHSNKVLAYGAGNLL